MSIHNPDKLTLAEMDEADAVEIFKAWRRGDTLDYAGQDIDRRDGEPLIWLNKWTHATQSIFKAGIYRINPTPKTRPWNAEDHNKVYKIGDVLEYRDSSMGSAIIDAVKKNCLYLFWEYDGMITVPSYEVIATDFTHNGKPCVVEIENEDG